MYSKIGSRHQFLIVWKIFYSQLDYADKFIHKFVPGLWSFVDGQQDIATILPSNIVFACVPILRKSYTVFWKKIGSSRLFFFIWAVSI